MPVELGPLAGIGRVESLDSSGQRQSRTGRLERLADVRVDTEEACTGLDLWIEEESTVAFVRCGSGHAFLCLGGMQECPPGELRRALRDGSAFRYYAEIPGLYYTAEIGPDRFVYRIEERRCLIPYPHGCLVPSFLWRDRRRHEFSRD